MVDVFGPLDGALRALLDRLDKVLAHRRPPWQGGA
jgi:hypothetical protein